MAKDVIKKYSPDGARAMQDNEDEMNARGKSAVKNYKEGKLGKAAVDVVKGVGTAAKNLAVTGPLAGVDAIQKRMAFGAKPDEENTPSEIQDKLQTMKNNRAADQYQQNRTFKSGGKVGSASKRADGCCVKGKTRGKIY